MIAGDKVLTIGEDVIVVAADAVMRSEEMAEVGNARPLEPRPALRCRAARNRGKTRNPHSGEVRMVNHNYEHENDAHESGDSWAGLLVGMY